MVGRIIGCGQKATMILPAFTAITFLLGGPQQNSGMPPLLTEIRGVVLEPGTNLPVVDAEISLFLQQPGPIRINGGWERDDARKARTDNSGAFALPLEKQGPYRVEAKKPGYIEAGASGAPNYAEVTLTVEKPAAETKLFLARPGRLTGTVVDEDTGKPIANLRLSAVRKRSARGFLRGDGTPSKTDAEGRFVATGLSPGEYAVEIGPQAEPDKRVLTRFTVKDAEAVERDYERTYWPGGHGQEAALPMPVASGATVNTGQLPVRKVPYYRVHVRIPVSSCGAGDTMHISESVQTSQTSMSIRPLAQVPCGRDVLVTGFSAGNYRLILGTDGRTPETRGTASVPFSIIDENIAITAPLTPGVTLEGALVAADGAKPPDFAKVKIVLIAVDGVGSMDEAMPAMAGPGGNFRIANVRPLGQRVFIAGLGPANYVKEIRYNGIPLSGDTVPLDRAAMAHMLTIVIDDKPGTITGAVVSGDKPVNRPFLVAMKWPPNTELSVSRWAVARGDDTGKFQMTGLAPGEYRVIALRSVNQDVSNAAVERALAAGRKIEIGPAGFQSVTLELAELWQ